VPVTRFEITQRRPLAGGRAFGEVGAYEELKGRLRLAIDPQHSANRAITDVALAPRTQPGASRSRRTSRSVCPSIGHGSQAGSSWTS